MGDFRRASTFFTMLVQLSRPFMRFPFRLRATGLEHIPAEGGFVLASNHLSNLDPWPVGVPLFPRQVHYMAKSELYRNPVLRLILERAGAFPVRRGERDPQSFKTAVAHARAGGVVAMFPEGTRRAKGLRKRHVAARHAGAARIALAAGVPLVPAAVKGTDQLRRLGPVRVSYGPPIDLQTNGARRVAAKDATERLMAAISELEDTL
jgi:1-acyl-sn-glycerol-3-phosphate acyltransferase